MICSHRLMGWEHGLIQLVTIKISARYRFNLLFTFNKNDYFHMFLPLHICRKKKRLIVLDVFFEEEKMDMECSKFLLVALSKEAAVEVQYKTNSRNFNKKTFLNLFFFSLSLSLELSNEDKSTKSHRLPGTMLKNFLDTKDATTNNWVNMDSLIKNQIKE